MTARVRFRDMVAALVPPWLSARVGKNVGYRVLWAMAAPLDSAAQTVVEGILSWFPGLGTPTALPLIGRSRGLRRGRMETVTDYAVRLRGWLDAWREAGSDERLARELQTYLGDAPRIRIFKRTNGACMTLNPDGTVVRHATTAWDWDSVSNPERAAFWSEMWIVVYPTPFLKRAGTLGGLSNDGYGIGHRVKLQEAEAAKGILAQWKSAHSRIRAVIWTTDATLFDPETPASMPDGTWGNWGNYGSGSRVKGNRNLSTCRYWEPR